MKIYLDDRRPLPEPGSGWVGVRTYDACVAVLGAAKATCDEVSLDFMLGGDHNGLDVLIFMNEKDIRPAVIRIHSSHWFGRRRMREYAERMFPASEVIMD